MDLNGTKTQMNLLAAFAGEAQAAVKYEYYAKQAKQDGYVQIGELFQETADNEKAHGKIWFKFLKDGIMPSTPDNLEDAATGENYEWSEMYKEFAQTARDEGFTHIAELFELVGTIEKEHEQRYLKLKANIENGEVYKKVGENVWQCGNCGHLYYGVEAPMVCPVCAHPQSYFRVQATNY